MPLPKIETPKYDIVVPSTQEVVEIRPFLVKEEKILLLAQESENSNQVLKALKDIIRACTFEKIDPNKLATYDLEYIFLQLRAKSVGESAKFQLKCSECGEYNDIEIDLTEIKVQFPEKEPEKKVMLTDEIGVVLRPIPVSEIESISDNENDITTMLSVCIESIFDNQNVYNSGDVSKGEMGEFIESLSRKQVEKIENFLKNQPYLSHTINFQCKSCGASNKVELTGLQSFFA